MLAFRRALSLDPGLARARQNLGWLRAQMPAWLPVASDGGGDSILAWRRIPGPLRLLAGALAFAVAALLAAPWGRAARGLRPLAAVAAVVSVALSASVGLEPDPARDAVLLQDGVTLRSADSIGAGAVLSNPLPAGAEVRVADAREGWAHVELANGSRGWVQLTSLGFVAPSRGGPPP